MTKKKIEDEATKTAENAEAKPADAAPPQGSVPLEGAQPFEKWAQNHNTPKWLVEGTRVGLQWPRGREMTEKQFLDGIEWAKTAPCR